MCANIDGLKIYPVSTSRSLLMLTSAKDANMPTTGIKVKDYFFIQNHFSLIPGMHNKPKNPPQKSMPMGVSNLMKTDNSMDLIGLQA
jgi:hypothetical protein